MRPRWVLLCGLVAMPGCSLGVGGSFPSDASARSAIDAPLRFEPANPEDRLTPGDTIAGSGCRSPMVDPRDGTRIVFLRAAGQRADYAVAGRQYGVNEHELLRIDCNTGTVIGVVDRGGLVR
jgi:hypothetical protein